MHIYMSQRALQEATEVIHNELLAFSYTMLKKGYDVEGIMEFLSVCDDEDIDFILEDADILTESVVNEMSDEDVNYYGEQLEVIVERLGIFKGLGEAALRKMSPAALRKLAASNPNIAKMIRKLGLLDDGAKQTIKVRPPARPGTVKKPKPNPGSGSGTTGSGSGTKGSGSGTTGPNGRPRLGTKGKIATGTAVGTGILASVFSPQIKKALTGDGSNGDTPATDMQGNPTGCKGPGGCSDGRGQDPQLGQTPPTPPKKEDPKPTPPKKPETGKTPWWLGPQGNQTKLGRRPRYDVALQSYRNPSQSLRNGFEMVADYLISEGHADTVGEARYVINQMEVYDITEILNEVLQ